MPEYRVTFTRPAPKGPHGEDQGEQSVSRTLRANTPAAALATVSEELAEPLDPIDSYTAAVTDLDGNDFPINDPTEEAQVVEEFSVKPPRTPKTS